MSSGRIGSIAAVLLVLALAACARPVGDFGRAEDDPVHDAAGALFHDLKGLNSPASDFNLTDQEKEMRDRVWRYLVAPADYDWLGDSAVELSRIGFLKPRFNPPPADRYYLWLHHTSFVSSPVRYARLGSDIKADLDTMPMVFAAICTVEGVDRQRGIAANGLPGLEAKMRLGAEAVHAENMAVIHWFASALDSRYQSYSYALDHLLVETPHEEAVGVDAELSQLQVYVEAAATDDFCTAGQAVSAKRREPGAGSRYLRSIVPVGGS